MPNVIAIVDDAKIRKQITGFFKELDEEGIRLRFFTTGFEFEQKYFVNKKSGSAHPLAVLEGFQHFSAEQIEASLAYPLTTKPISPHATTQIRINKKSQKVENVEPILDANQTFLSQFVEDLLNNPNAIGQVVLPEFLEIWNSLLQKPAGPTSVALLPLLLNKKEVAWVKAQVLSSSLDKWEIAISEVTNQYRERVDKELARRQSHEEESEELQLFSQIDLIIFKSDCISGKVPQWLDQTWRKLKEGGFSPPENTIRFVLLKYEDDGVSKLDVLHHKLDDLVYLPLDRLIFLQKLEILMGLPKKTTPTFLFNQPVNMTIEISKLTKLEKLSDLGLVIRNPVRLVEGLLAHFYLTFPDEEEPINIWGKVLKSEPHPERQHEFLITFSFFGLRRQESSVIKRHLAKGNRYSPFIESDRKQFEYNPDDLFLDAQESRFHHVAILDLDEGVIQQIRGSLLKDIDQLKVVGETSFAAFSGRFLGGSKALASTQIPTGESDFPISPIHLTAHPTTLDMTSTLTTFSEDQTYFGVKANEVLATVAGWRTPFKTLTESMEVLNEMVRLAAEGRSVSRLVPVVAADQTLKLVRVTTHPGDTIEHVKVEIAWPSKEDTKPKTQENLGGLEFMIVDFTLIPGGNVSNFITAVTDAARSQKLIGANDNIRFMILTDSEKQFRHQEWADPRIIAVLAKPVEPRPISFFVANALKSPFTLYRLDNMGWQNTLLPIHVAKEIQIASISEFGAELVHSRPIAPGSVLFLRGGIYDNAPNRCLAARFYHCEEDAKEKGRYICLATYFGINDGFMKYARRWFRESYAQSKSQEEKS